MINSDNISTNNQPNKMNSNFLTLKFLDLRLFRNNKTNPNKAAWLKFILFTGEYPNALKIEELGKSGFMFCKWNK